MARLSDVFLEKNRANDITAWARIRKDVRFHLRPTVYQPYIDAVSGLENLDQAARDKGYLEAIAKHLIISWENLQNDDGTAMEPTLEAKVSLLDSYAEISLLVLTFCNDLGNFVGQNSATEAELKN